MPNFRYVAIDGQGQLQRGSMQAAEQSTVIEWLQKQGLIPMQAEPAPEAGFWVDFSWAKLTTKQGLSRQDLTNVTRELATMLSAGQDLDRALRFLVDTASHERVRTIMGQVREKVRSGSALATALAQQPDSFPRLYVGLVRAGEAGASLTQTLGQLADLLERERSLNATLRSAMIYPGMLLVAVIGSITLLLTQVLPQFVPLFEQNGAQLPTATQFMISFGAMVSSLGPWFLLVLLVAFLVGRNALKSPPMRLAADRLMLRLPIVGNLLRETIAARFTRTLGALLSNGVSLISALAIVKDTLGNMAAMAAVENATESAKSGTGLARPLKNSGIFPARTIHLIFLGEETAQLANISLRAAEIHEEHVRIMVQRLVSLLVPVITITMGIAVASIIGSLLLAMLSLNDLAG